MGDEQVGQAEAVLQVLEQVDDAGLDRHVEGGDRLVEHEQRRLERQRPGDADPLALPAGELVREPVAVLRVETDQLEQLRTRRLWLPGSRWIFIGSVMVDPTVMRGSRLA